MLEKPIYIAVPTDCLRQSDFQANSYYFFNFHCSIHHTVTNTKNLKKYPGNFSLQWSLILKRICTFKRHEQWPNSTSRKITYISKVTDSHKIQTIRRKYDLSAPQSSHFDTTDLKWKFNQQITLHFVILIRIATTSNNYKTWKILE